MNDIWAKRCNLAKRIEILVTGPCKEWIKGVTNVIEKNGEANVAIVSNGSVTRAHAGIVHVCTCMCVHTCVCACVR